jgi:hypothetical protein
MQFDFLNYTYSAAVSLVTAVFGLSYPLLIESIQRIDKKYKSLVLKKRFENSITYRCYNGLLIISVFVAIFMPFLLASTILYTVVEYILITLQVALLLLLVCMTLCLVQKIQLYNDPESLLNEIVNNGTESDVKAVLDIMRYVSKDFPDTYRKGMDFIMKLIIKENVKHGK